MVLYGRWPVVPRPGCGLFMLSLSKRVDYALIALTYLAQRRNRVVSAREIAEKFGLPQALVMNILKSLAGRGWLTSERGSQGGYRLCVSLDDVNVYDLVENLEGPVRLAECVVRHAKPAVGDGCRIGSSCPIQSPISTLHGKWVGFLREVKLSDLLNPGNVGVAR